MHYPENKSRLTSQTNGTQTRATQKVKKATVARHRAHHSATGLSVIVVLCLIIPIKPPLSRITISSYSFSPCKEAIVSPSSRRPTSRSSFGRLFPSPGSTITERRSKYLVPEKSPGPGPSNGNWTGTGSQPNPAPSIKLSHPIPSRLIPSTNVLSGLGPDNLPTYLTYLACFALPKVV